MRRHILVFVFERIHSCMLCPVLHGAKHACIASGCVRQNEHNEPTALKDRGYRIGVRSCFSGQAVQREGRGSGTRRRHASQGCIADTHHRLPALDHNNPTMRLSARQNLHCIHKHSIKGSKNARPKDRRQLFRFFIKRKRINCRFDFFSSSRNSFTKTNGE